MSRVRTAWTIAALLAAIFAGTARAAPAALLIEAELVPERVYVGGEARLRLRLLRAPGVPHGVLRSPELGDAAELSLLGPIRTYQDERGGVLYDVIERTHVIVPRRAGRLEVPGAEFESALRYVEMFHRDARAASAPLSARGPQRVLEVRPVPAGAGEPWLPARRVTLEETWSRDLQAFADGAPVTRTLVLRAEGLAAERLPRLEVPAHPALLAHHDQPELATEYLAEGMTGRRVQRIVLMPVGEGEVSLPELSVYWWDIEADAPRTATLAARTLRLGAAPIAPAAPLEEDGFSPQNILRGIAAAILLLAVALLWWHMSTQMLREARRQLRAACQRNDPRAARAALAEWWTLVNPGAPVPLVQRMGANWDADARAQLATLDAALYAGRAWNGKAFWRRVRPWLRKSAARSSSLASPMPGLYRLQARAARRVTTSSAIGQ